MYLPYVLLLLPSDLASPIPPLLADSLSLLVPPSSTGTAGLRTTFRISSIRSKRILDRSAGYRYKIRFSLFVLRLPRS